MDLASHMMSVQSNLNQLMGYRSIGIGEVKPKHNEVSLPFAEQWRQAEGVWIPREENSIKLEQFRSISLLSVEGKIFLSALSRRMTDFLLTNTYIASLVHKGGIPGIAGCLEHTRVSTQLIRKACKGKGDLTNACGSMPHKLLETTLDQHSVPCKIKSLILNYYVDLGLDPPQRIHQVGIGLRSGL